jgi:xylulokinase
MTRDLLLGIDAGTTSLKAALCDPDGRILAQASQEYPTAYPRPNSQKAAGSWAEQNPHDWWRALCAATPQVIAAAGADPRAIAGVGVSGQAPSLVAVNRAGEPLRPALIWLDRRADAQCAWLHERVGAEAIASVNGGRIDPYYLAPKLLWFKQHEPELYRQTHAVLQANGYLVHRLCAAFCMDVSNGPLTSFFDSRNTRYDESLVSAMGLDLARMPAVRTCAEVVGEVTAEAAAATGLAAGTPVIAGMCDGTAAGLEAGLLRVGDAVEMTGQSTVLLICSDQPYLGQDLIPLVHAVPGRYLVVGALVATGGALRWFRDQLGEVERLAAGLLDVDAFELLSQEAGRSPAGANGVIFLPYMFGERSPIWDSAARGVFFGLSLATRRADLVRAIMEGAAFGLRHNAATAAERGFATTGLFCVGGGSRSPVWNQIKADVLQTPLRVPAAATGAALGDALAVGVATGVYASFEEAVRRVVRAEQEYRPNAALRGRYDELYRIYVNLYPALRESFRDLAALAVVADG